MTSIRTAGATRKDGKFVERDGNRVGDDLITDNLRRVYGAVAAEPLPLAFLDLLKKLDEREPGP